MTVTHYMDQVSVTPPFTIDLLMVYNNEGQSSLVLAFCVNFEWQVIFAFTYKYPYNDYIDVSNL